MTLLISRGYNGVSDPDAAAYVAAVEAADGQLLENAVGKAINAFVIGCKNDGIWTAIKASCILAGARTLAGALVPLVGAAPTSTLSAQNYSRKTGVRGTGTLTTNRNSNLDPQNSFHMAAYRSEGIQATPPSEALFTDDNSAATGSNQLFMFQNALYYRNRSSIAFAQNINPLGFLGTSRSQSSQYTVRANLSNSLVSNSSETPRNFNLIVSPNSTTRIAFYSMGEALNLELLDARVTTLITALGVAIP